MTTPPGKSSSSSSPLKDGELSKESLMDNSKTAIDEEEEILSDTDTDNDTEDELYDDELEKSLYRREFEDDEDDIVDLENDALVEGIEQVTVNIIEPIFSVRSQMLLTIADLINAMFELARTTTLLYNDLRAELLASNAFMGITGNTEEDIEATRAMARMIVILQNMARLFHPRLLLLANDVKNRPQNICIQLLVGIGNAIQHLIENGHNLLQQLTPLLDQVEIDSCNETVWADLEHFQSQLLQFMSSVISPQLIASAAVASVEN